MERNCCISFLRIANKSCYNAGAGHIMMIAFQCLVETSLFVAVVVLPVPDVVESLIVKFPKE